ncbi:MAG: hypothetical protein AAGL90_15315 [Pseudomonadota bacterium]
MNRRRKFVDHVKKTLGVSERLACRFVGQTRSTQSRRLRIADNEHALTSAIISLARQYGRYGDRRLTELGQNLPANVIPPWEFGTARMPLETKLRS